MPTGVVASPHDGICRTPHTYRKARERQWVLPSLSSVDHDQGMRVCGPSVRVVSEARLRLQVSSNLIVCPFWNRQSHTLPLNLSAAIFATFPHSDLICWLWLVCIWKGRFPSGTQFMRSQAGAAKAKDRHPPCERLNGCACGNNHSEFEEGHTVQIKLTAGGFLGVA